MAIRRLREGIIDSNAVNSLSEDAEVFYRRVMSIVTITDDTRRTRASSALGYSLEGGSVAR